MVVGGRAGKAISRPAVYMDIVKEIENLLYLDCQKKDNVKTIVRALYEIKPIKKEMVKRYGETIKPVPLPVIENILEQFEKRYGLRFNNMFPYYENGKLEFYKADVINKNRIWFGSAMGKTITETMYKVVLKMYYLIKTGKYMEDKSE